MLWCCSASAPGSALLPAYSLGAGGLGDHRIGSSVVMDFMSRRSALVLPSPVRAAEMSTQSGGHEAAAARGSMVYGEPVDDVEVLREKAQAYLDLRLVVPQPAPTWRCAEQTAGVD